MDQVRIHTAQPNREALLELEPVELAFHFFLDLKEEEINLGRMWDFTSPTSFIPDESWQELQEPAWRLIS